MKQPVKIEAICCLALPRCHLSSPLLDNKPSLELWASVGTYITQLFLVDTISALYIVFLYRAERHRGAFVGDRAGQPVKTALPLKIILNLSCTAKFLRISSLFPFYLTYKIIIINRILLIYRCFCVDGRY